MPNNPTAEINTTATSETMMAYSAAVAPFSKKISEFRSLLIVHSFASDAICQIIRTDKGYVIQSDNVPLIINWEPRPQPSQTCP